MKFKITPSNNSNKSGLESNSIGSLNFKKKLEEELFYSSIKTCTRDILNLNLYEDLFGKFIELKFYFNSGKHNNFGTEVSVHHKANQEVESFAKGLNFVICESLSTVNRGLKKRQEIISSKRDEDLILVYICYSTNSRDVLKYKLNRTELLENISKYLKAMTCH
jgi:hypothetical protein